MSTNDTFQARIVTSLSTPGGPEAIKIFNELDAASKLLSGDAQKAAADVAKLFKAFNEGKTDGRQFMLQLEGMAESLKLLSTIQKTKALSFTSEEVNNILNMAKALSQMSRAFTELQKAQGVGKGNYGLDSKNLKESGEALKVLDTNLKAVKLGLSQQPNSPGLLMQRDQIQGNIDALTRYREAQKLTQDAFTNVGKNMPALEKASTSIGATISKKVKEAQIKEEAERIAIVKKGLDNYLNVVRQFETDELNAAQKRNKALLLEEAKAAKERLAQKRKEIKEAFAEEARAAKEAFKSQDVRYQLRKEDSEFYRSAAGRTTAFNRYDVKQAGNEAAQAPGFVQSKIFGTQRTEEARYLRDAFTQANTKYQSSGALAVDTEKVKNLLAQVLIIEKEIVLARSQGKIDLQFEAQQIAKIGQLQKLTNIERQKARASDPLIRQAEQEAQTRRMFERISGSSGGALLAVQATLMGNYSVLQGLKTAVTSAVTYSIELEAAFKNIQAVTVTTKTDMVDLEAAIKKAAGTTKFNAKEVADAALILGQAGLTARQVAEAVQPVVMLATASGATLAQAVDIVTSVVGVFNVTVGETADVANKITYAVNVSKLSIEKLALGFQYAGNTAAQLGVSFEEVTGAMAAMSNAGIKSGSTMGTGLRQLFVELQSPSKEFISSLHQVGLTIGDLDLKTQSFSSILKKLRDSGFAASEAIKSFDIRGAAAFNSLIANPEMLDATVAGMNNTRAAVEANEVQMESLKNQLARLTSAFGNLVSAGFAPVQEALTKIVGGFATLIQSISESRGAVELFGTLMAGALAAGAAAFIGLVGRNMLALAGDLALLSKTAPGIARVGASMVAAATGTGIFATSLAALKVILSPTALGLALTAITAGYFLYQRATSGSKQETEKLTTELDRARGVMNEKKEVIDSLGKKINELQDKTKFYTEDLKALQTETQSNIVKFGQFGFSADVASTSIGGLISKLKGLKTQMENLQGFQMNKVIKAAEELAGQKAEAARQSADLTLQGPRGTKLDYLGNLIKDPAFQSLISSQGGVGKDRLKVLRAYQSQVESGKNPGQIPELGQVADIVSSLQAEVKSAKKGEIPQAIWLTNKLNEVSDRFVKAAETSGEAATALSEVLKLKGTAATASETLRFNQATRFDDRLVGIGSKLAGGDLALGGNISDIAKAQAGKGASPAEVYKRGKALLDQALVQVGVMSAELDQARIDRKFSPEVLHDATVKLTQSRNKYINQVQTLATDAKDIIELEDYNLERQNKSAVSLAQAKQKRGAQVTEELIRLRKQKGQLDLEKQLRDVPVTDKSRRELLIKQSEDVVATDIEAIRERAQQAGEEAARKGLQAQLNSLENASRVEMSKAQLAKGRLTSMSTLQEIKAAMDEGIAHIAEAKKIELKKVELQIRSGTGMASDRASKVAEMKTATESYVTSFESYVNASIKQLYEMKQTIKEAKNRLDQMRLDAEANTRSRTLAARELNIKAASEGPTGMKAAYRETELGDAQGTLNDVRAMMQQVGQTLNQINSLLAARSAERVSVSSRLERFQGLSEDQRSKLSAKDLNEEYILRKQLAALNESINDLERDGIDFQKRKNDLLDQEYEARLRIANATDKSKQPLTIDSYSSAFKKALSDYQEDMKKLSPEEALASGFYQTLNGMQDKFTTFFTDIASGSKSASQAFRAFAASIVSELLKIVAQQAAIALVKSLFSLFSGGAGDAGGVEGVGGWGSSDIPSMGATARHGGSISRWGTVQHFAQGGPVTGGTPGRDSVPALVMPGEFVLKSSAVDAVGTDFLHALNNAGNGVVSSSSPKQGAALSQGGSGTINVWVVSPDQKPVPGPKDIVAIVTDDMARGGSIKQMVKSVQMGTV